MSVVHGTLTINYEQPWITKPISLSSSRKLSEKAAKHEKSGFHRQALAISEIKRGSNETIQTTVIRAAQSQNKEKKNLWHRLFFVAYYLFKNEIPHITNWVDLISTIAVIDTTGEIRKYFASLASNAHHLSTTTITEILEAFGSALRQQTIQLTAALHEFSIMADEATDINRQILSVCCRYIDSQSSPHKVIERFIGIAPMASTCSQTVTETLLSILKSVGLPVSSLVAVSFDGASNFSGEKSGVFARLRELCPKLIYVHCRAHLLQLAVVHAASRQLHIHRIISLMNKI